MMAANSGESRFKDMEELEMIVEIPRGSSNKYEFDMYKMQWKLDRVLYGAMIYPEEYGYIPDTLGYDGDPLDIVCLTSYPTFPSCRIAVNVIGVLRMVDQSDLDYKIIAVNAKDPRFLHINQLREIGPGKLNEISNFFFRYKEIENKQVTIEGYGGKEEALELVKECSRLFIERATLCGRNASKQQTLEFLKGKGKLN